MALGDYEKTTYVNGSAPGLSAQNLNKNENKTEELDNALATHLADTTHMPIGGIIMWSGAVDAVPTGWGLCNGSEYDLSNGTGKITAPDLRNRFIVGAGDEYTVGVTGGEKTHILTEAEMPSHSHNVSISGGAHSHSASSNSAGDHSHGGSTSSDGGHTHSYYSPGPSINLTSGSGIQAAGTFMAGTTGSAGSHSHSISTGSAGSHSHGISINSASHSHSASAGSTGSGQAHENRPPYYALAFIIKL